MEVLAIPPTQKVSQLAGSYEQGLSIHASLRGQGIDLIHGVEAGVDPTFAGGESLVIDRYVPIFNHDRCSE
jgi:hypothetical protein